MHPNKRIFIAGHNGMLGSAVVRLLEKRGYTNLILKTRKELDLRDSAAVNKFFVSAKPEVVILTAARVGGIQANINYPGEFLYENMMIQSNTLHESFLNNVEKFVFLGSSCIYPSDCVQPMKEEHLMSGKLERTNEGYALAKITGIKLLEFYQKQYGFQGLSLIPCNLYGTNDSFDPILSHVLSALVKKMVDAAATNQQAVSVWGSGVARREFMHVDDAAAAILHFMNTKVPATLVNIGWGEDISIKDLAVKIAKLSNFKGEIIWDVSKPNGMIRKCMDVSKMKEYGYTPQIALEVGILKTIEEYKMLSKEMTGETK